jgi:selenocysteine lyase/cysteine desulfurase
MKRDNSNLESFFNRVRKKQYAILDKSAHVYLDYTGGNMYPKCLVEMHHKFLQNAVYGNPHSTNPSSQLSEKLVNESRRSVLDFFNAPDYDCVFTSNATGALQIVGECYPFSTNSHLLLTADNHNSVNGIREYCQNKRGSYSYCPLNYDDLTINTDELNYQLSAHSCKENKLFAFPAQSNASGVQHSLAWIKKAHDQGWDVLLDAAAFVPTSKLDLTIFDADFVSLSFYKMFGYPTGIGCLLVKKSKINKFVKRWFAGGTVTLSAVRHQGHFLKSGHERFENGTVSYLTIPAIANGLDFIAALGIDNITCWVKELSEFFIYRLLKLKHENGKPLIKLYGPMDTKNRGGTFLINFFDTHGKQYPFEYIEGKANAENISLRTGCFCNPGVDEINNSLCEKRLKQYFTSRHDGEYKDMIGFLGNMRGAVRVSIGFPTTRSDLNKFLSFAKKFLNRVVREENQCQIPIFETGTEKKNQNPYRL